jgi:hypothetical protein
MSKREVKVLCNMLELYLSSSGVMRRLAMMTVFHSDETPPVPINQGQKIYRLQIKVKLDRRVVCLKFISAGHISKVF